MVQVTWIRTEATYNVHAITCCFTEAEGIKVLGMASRRVIDPGWTNAFLAVGYRSTPAFMALLRDLAFYEAP